MVEIRGRRGSRDSDGGGERAEQERGRAERLAARLRELGEEVE